MSSIESFTKKCVDNSSQAGFQFSFYCDICGESYKTNFVEYKGNKAKGLLSGLAKAASIGASISSSYTRNYQAEYAIQRTTDEISQHLGGTDAGYQKAHTEEFDKAEQEAKTHFKHCPKCRKWVCSDDWNEKDGVCLDESKAGTQAGASAQPNTSQQTTTPQQPTQPQQANPPQQVAASQTTTGNDDVFKVLKMRLAKGEITSDEYEKLKQELQ